MEDEITTMSIEGSSRNELKLKLENYLTNNGWKCIGDIIVVNWGNNMKYIQTIRKSCSDKSSVILHDINSVEIDSFSYP